MEESYTNNQFTDDSLTTTDQVVIETQEKNDEDTNNTDPPIEVRNKTGTKDSQHTNLTFRLWCTRAGQRFGAAWNQSKPKVIWLLCKVIMRILILFSFSVVLTSLDTRSDFALAKKYFR